jgi:RNA polymerase sigma-70 factor, ECF subfamily
VTGAEPLSGREERLAALFDAHGRAVYAYARRRASAADAEEVVSETFLVAWRRLDDVPGEPVPWLLGVARRCLANVTRGQARQSALQLRLASLPQEESPAPGSLSAPLRQALARLSEGEREAITLLAWEGLSPAEAATALGCSRAAVYLRLHRARRRLATELTDPGVTT